MRLISSSWRPRPVRSLRWRVERGMSASLLSWRMVVSVAAIWWVIARMMGGGSVLLSMWTTLGAHLGTWQVAGRSLRKPLPIRHLVAQCGTLEA